LRKPSPVNKIPRRNKFRTSPTVNGETHYSCYPIKQFENRSLLAGIIM